MKEKIIVFLFILTALFCGCSDKSRLIKQENEQLKIMIEELESELQNLKPDSEIVSITINYMDNKSKKVFVETQIDLLGLPLDNSIKINTIYENTVVDVLDTAVVNNATWLYVSIPVLKSPSNYKGWIKESDTVLYTEDIMSKVRSVVTVTDNEDVYETFNFEDIDKVTPYKANKERGRIEEKKDGYARIDCTGGKTIWVKETSIIYPDVE